MPLEEITNVLTASSGSTASSLNSSPSGIASDHKERPAAEKLHPWIEGRRVLVPVPIGEEKRRARLRLRSGVADTVETTSGEESSEGLVSPMVSHGNMHDHQLFEENERLRAELAKAASNGDKLACELEDLRDKHRIIAAERDSLQLDLAKHEDELFILRQTNEEHAQVVSNLRKAREVAENEAQHTLALTDALGESTRLRVQLEKVEKELQQSQSDQNEQHVACMQLLEEQEKLELAYEDAVAQLYEYKRADQGDTVSEFGLAGTAYTSPDDEEVGSVYQGDERCLSDHLQAEDPLADQSWDYVELGDLGAAPTCASVTTKRKPLHKVFTLRARARSQPLLYSAVPPQGDVITVKNDVEQLKQTIALLVRERLPSSDIARSDSSL
ncbi:hypothetical protein JCM3770_001884 [Rhodotorula araucariae]